MRQNENESLRLNSAGQVLFSRGSVNEYIKSSEGQEMVGPTGGIQGAKGTLFGMEYPAGGLVDNLIESFAGTHDSIGGSLTNLYDSQGNIKRGMSSTERGVYNNLVTTTAIVPSIPFAAAEVLPPEVWKAVSLIIKAVK